MSAIRVFAAFAALSSCVSLQPVAAANPATNLDEVVITATRTREPVTQLAVPVIVITRAAIEDALAGDAADLIAVAARHRDRAHRRRPASRRRCSCAAPRATTPRC